MENKKLESQIYLRFFFVGFNEMFIKLDLDKISINEGILTA